jgi:cysteine desulfurase
MKRVYLDWNATAPLRPEARDAMLVAMGVLGNPSSVHGEGREAKSIVEKARAQVAAAFGAASADIVFTGSATEAASLALQGRGLQCSKGEHDCVTAWCDANLPCDVNGLVGVVDPKASALQAVNSEVGIVQNLPDGLAVSDFVQAFGKLPVGFDWSDVDMALLSAHKIGGPAGIGALVVKQGIEVPAQIKGGGQEQGRRAGTENLIGIAGFGAAAEAAARDLDAGMWADVETLRDQFEARLLAQAPELLIFGESVKRLPNTSYFAIPGWKSETQVMQMDLAGYAISAGSACSSGKVKPSTVLLAMGYDDVTAASAIRVSIGPSTTEQELMGFADTWLTHYHRFVARAA